MERSFGREVANVLLRAAVVVFSVLFIFAMIDAWYSLEAIGDGTCNVAVLPIEGVIMPYDSYAEFPLVTTPKTVRDFIGRAEEDPTIRGVLLEINSPGGTPVASEQISDIIAGTSLSTISLIGDLGASGGYMVAASADKVLASSMSDIGSIGVTMSYTENSKQNEEEGLTFVELSSGKFKDAGNPNKPLTEEERELFEKDLQVIHDEFVKKIAESRELSVEKVQELADGSTMPGARALENGLIDQIGNRTEAKQEFAHMLQIDVSEIEFCEYTGGLLPF